MLTPALSVDLSTVAWRKSYVKQKTFSQVLTIYSLTENYDGKDVSFEELRSTNHIYKSSAPLNHGRLSHMEQRYCGGTENSILLFGEDGQDFVTLPEPSQLLTSKCHTMLNRKKSSCYELVFLARSTQWTASDFLCPKC